MGHIVRDTADVNLDDLASKIREECAGAERAGRTALEHGIAAGKYALQVHAQINRGFRRWLTEHDLKKTNVYDFMKLAEHEESVRSSGHSSIAAALRMLRGKSGKSSKSKTSSTDSPLSKVAWTKATLDEQRKFLDAVGADALCKAMSFTLRAELSRRVAGQRRATNSALDEILSKAIRQALSLQKSAKSKDGPAMGVAAALNAINNKLAAVGMDLNDINVAIDPIASRRAA